MFVHLIHHVRSAVPLLLAVLCLYIRRHPRPTRKGAAAASDVYKGQGHDEETTTVVVNPGEFFIVPKGVEHKPTATEETHLLLFEPLSTKHTGDVQADITVESYEEI